MFEAHKDVASHRLIETHARNAKPLKKQEVQMAQIVELHPKRDEMTFIEFMTALKVLHCQGRDPFLKYCNDINLTNKAIKAIQNEYENPSTPEKIDNEEFKRGYQDGYNYLSGDDHDKMIKLFDLFTDPTIDLTRKEGK